jgi:uncharacterized protein
MPYQTKAIKAPRIIQAFIRDVASSREFYQEISQPIVTHPEYLKLRGFRHHHHSTIYDHCLLVARWSYTLGRFLGIGSPELIRGALMHDFFLYDWRTTHKPGGRPHAFAHPRAALENSTRVFGELSPLERDIIRRHMWPVTLLPPKSLEGMLVSLVDKLVATWEFATGIHKTLISIITRRSLKAAAIKGRP